MAAAWSRWSGHAAPNSRADRRGRADAELALRQRDGRSSISGRASASARLDIQRGRIIGFLAALALVFLGVRVYVLTLTWRDVDSRFIEFHALRKGRSDCGLINAE